MDPVYSCKHNPSAFKLLNPNKPYPFPKDGSNTYKWYLSNITPDMDKFKVILAFQKAFEIWQRGLDIIEPVGNYLNFESTNDATQADFVFTFGSGSHTFLDFNGTTKNCPFPFDGSSGVLAHAWGYTQSSGFAGTMHLDEAEPWSDMHNVNLAVHLLTVVLHELGHILDIGHSDVRDAIMWPSYSGIKTNLNDDDLNALEIKLGPIKKHFKDLDGSSNPPPPDSDPEGCAGPTIAAIVIGILMIFI